MTGLIGHGTGVHFSPRARMGRVGEVGVARAIFLGGLFDAFCKVG